MTLPHGRHHCRNVSSDKYFSSSQDCSGTREHEPIHLRFLTELNTSYRHGRASALPVCWTGPSGGTWVYGEVIQAPFINSKVKGIQSIAGKSHGSVRWCLCGGDPKISCCNFQLFSSSSFTQPVGFSLTRRRSGVSCYFDRNVLR